jgi:Abnormal spindle-like microcephaly-assoc'd, ASPM-SPD-2-Hydin
MAAAVALVLLIGPTAQAAQPVLQRGYDAGVSGATLTETTLNTSNVAPNTFGLVFTLPLDDSVFAQPLYVPNVTIPNQGTHNVVYVATMSDTLYAFDADVGGAPLWSVNFASLVGAMPVPIADFVFSGNKNIVGNLGILSTPVIDASTHILYLVACTLENSTLAYRLHAVDITTGAEPYGPGVLISGSYGGSTFDARYQLQRVSLALSGSQVVFGFSAVELEYPGGYVGWVMAYNKLKLQQSGVFATVTTGNRGGGVWQSGRPPVVDSSGYVYVFVGNGHGCCGYDGVNNFSESALKLDPANGLALLDWFTAGNWSYLDTNDFDLSSSGPLLIPGTSLLAGGGKTGKLYVLNTTNLGKYNATDSQVVQEEVISAREIRGGPVYWQRSTAAGGPLLYNWGASDSVKAYPFNGTKFATSPSAQGSGYQIWPGGILALSANGEQPGSGVLWATVATSGDAENNPPVPGELHAFDAANVSLELWNSTMNASRDGFGNFAKFVPPLVVNGKVYVATWSNQVAVYGLLLPTYTVSLTSLAFGSEPTNVASAPMLITVKNTGNVGLPLTSITLSGANLSQFSQTNTCGTAVALGATCTISVVFKPTTTGWMQASLNVNGGGGAGTQTVALSGTGVVPTYTVSPASVAFGSETTNVASAPMLIAVTNTGNLPLPITSITLSGANLSQFSQTNTCGTAVALGATCTISVVFKPTVTGSKTATLNVNAGGGAGTQTVALTGVGVVPTYTVSPASVAFGTEQPNVASAPMLIVVTNTGNQPLPITNITLSGTDFSQFSQTNTCGTPVALGATCTISVVFKPTSIGSKTATLNVNAGGVPIVVPLSGVVPLSVSVKASAVTVTAGKSVALTWVATTGASCSATGGSATDGWSGSIAASGTKAVTESAAGTYFYGLNCTAGSQTQQAQASVVVTRPVVTVSLSASPTTFTAGQSTTLTWKAANATSCAATGGGSNDNWPGAKATSGSIAVTEPNTLTAASVTLTYTLTCTSAASNGSAQASAKVVEQKASSGSSGGGGAFDALSLAFLCVFALHRVRREIRL